MNGLVGKEIRSILPVWLVAMALSVLPVWIVWPGPQGAMLNQLGWLVFAPFGLGALLLSLTPFGHELNWGTFPVLLSQPVSRSQVWRAKILVVGAALGVAFLALCISNHFRVDWTLASMKQTVWRNAFERPGESTPYFVKLVADTRRVASQDTFVIGGLEVLAGLAGGLWTTLLFRQVTAAFWLTLLVPISLSVLCGSALKNFPDAVGNTVLAVLLGIYSVLGFVWARRQFLRVQDTQWTGGVIALPAWSELLAGGGSLELVRKRKPLRALVRKEFQAQQVNVLLAGGLLLLHLGVIAVRRWGREYLSTHQSTAMILEMVPLLWLAMPLLIGGVAVAEERKLGMFQSALCLAVSRRAQFFVKLMLAGSLALLLGGVLPLLLERLAPQPLSTDTQTGLAFLGGIRPMDYLQIFGCLGLTFLAFYGSTLTRNSLQGMGAGLAAALVTGVIIGLAQHAGDSWELMLWRGPLIAWVGFPVMGLVLLVLAHRNYGKLQPDGKTWGRNMGVVLVALLGVAVVTTTIYHRAWEAWMPEEPPHRFFSGFDRVEPAGRTIVVTTPAANEQGYLGASLQELTPELAKEFKFEQTNGVLVANVVPDAPADLAGLKSGDIVLRFNGQNVSGPKQLASAIGATKPDSRVPVEISRNGSDLTLGITVAGQPHMRRIVRRGRAPAKIVASGSQRAVVLPHGRLWLQERSMRPMAWRDVHRGMVVWYSAGPLQTGFADGSDWVDVAVAPGGAFAIKTDGSLWEILPAKQGGFDWKVLGSDRDWASLSAGWDHFSALKSDGTLWQWGWKQTEAGPTFTEPAQIGSDKDWVTVCDSVTKSAAMKADGSIWQWDWRERMPNPPRPWLMGSCTEPISFALSSRAVAAVCADGSLWIGGDLTNSAYARLIGEGEAPLASREMIRWGNDSDWREVRFVGWGKAVGVKRDGTLWEWDVNQVLGPRAAWVAPATMPSRFGDWISVCEDDNAFLALARDGTLCLWGEPGYGGYDYNGLPYSNQLLAPSRIKARQIADFAR